MALSFLTESEAPRDFRISSTESDGHFTKCLLCYTIKRNFHCVDCLKTGNFVHTSMPYSDRYADKQIKLRRLKANRKHVLDHCETLLQTKGKYDSLHTEVKQCRDKIDLLKLAIEQRRNNIEEKKKELNDITKLNAELKQKLPRYQKRVSSLGNHVLLQKTELQNQVGVCNEKAQTLASLRRERIRQLNKYIFPVYVTYDTSESIDDIEILLLEPEDNPVSRERLHFVTAWVPADGDYSSIHWDATAKDSVPGYEIPALRTGAALALAAQLTNLLAWTLDQRLPTALPLNEYWVWRVSETGAESRARRIAACCVWLLIHSAALPPPTQPRAALAALCDIARAAATDEPSLGRVEGWRSSALAAAGAAWGAAWPHVQHEECDPPEHLSWPETAEMEEVSGTPPNVPAPSLVTSAAHSLVSMFRGWTK